MLLGRREFLGIGAFSLMAGCGGAIGVGSGDILAWGTEGLREGAFNRPRAIGVHEGEVYVIDTTGRIQVFAETGKFRRLWKTPDAANGTPTSITFHGDTVVVPDTHYSRIIEYSTAGELRREWGSYGNGPEEFIYPTCVTLDSDGTHFVSEYGEYAERIHVFDADRKFLRQWGAAGDQPGQFSRPMAIEIGTRGEVFVADTGNHRIQVFDREGALLRIVGAAGTERGQLKFPFDIAFAPDGTLLVCEYGTHRISRFDEKGVFMGAIGGPGRRPGTFNSPRGVAAGPDGMVYVADTYNHRVQRIPLEMFT